MGMGESDINEKLASVAI